MQVTHEPQAQYVDNRVQAHLHVERENIVFYNVAPDRVRIQITLTNLGLERSRRTELQLQAAPLGVFLPWKDLATLWVPPLAASEVVTLSTEVSCPRPRPLGRFDRVPPDRLLTALGMFDGGEEDEDGERPHRSSVRTLPPDPMDLLGQGNPHWAGNINVFVGKRAVERHRAKALRIYPGQNNFALLIVGNTDSDAYSFELRGNGAAWNTHLQAVTLSHYGDPVKGMMPITPGQWYDAVGMLMCYLAIQPPASATRGEVEVCVTRRSTEEMAIVEFSLDASAQGPGCYTA